jgi:hypothetical protein
LTAHHSAALGSSVNPRAQSGSGTVVACIASPSVSDICRLPPRRASGTFERANAVDQMVPPELRRA